MLRKLFGCISLVMICGSSFALTHQPNFVILPNIKTQYLMSINAAQAITLEKRAIELVKKTLNITPESPYRTVRIRFIYNNNNQPEALIVYLLSSQYKSFELVRINLNSDFTVATVIYNYRLKPEDQSQSPAYAYKATHHCPDESVQFVIGNNFIDDPSVEKEVQKVYQLTKTKGYHPILMDTNNSQGPQPTIQAYENWLSCPNVKGFYNESHGNNEEILLSDGDFIYSLVDNDLIDKLNHDVVLFDSCETFNDPLLSSMTSREKGDSQQYIAGFISLPFGSSERTASCFWAAALDRQSLTQEMINDCSDKSGLERDAFRIRGTGDNHLTPAS